jgi:hypothetical protein
MGGKTFLIFHKGATVAHNMPKASFEAPQFTWAQLVGGKRTQAIGTWAIPDMFERAGFSFDPNAHLWWMDSGGGVNLVGQFGADPTGKATPKAQVPVAVSEEPADEPTEEPQPIEPEEAPPQPIEAEPTSNEIEASKLAVHEWGEQLAALPPPGPGVLKDDVGFSVATNTPMRHFLGRVGPDTPLEDWLRASRLLVVHSKTQLPRQQVLKAVKTLEAAVVEKKGREIERLDPTSYDPLPDDYNIVDLREGKVSETGHGTVAWEWKGSSDTRFQLPDKLYSSALAYLAERGYRAEIQTRRAGGHYDQAVYRLVVDLHGIPALIAFLREQGLTKAPPKVQAAWEGWSAARPEAAARPASVPKQTAERATGEAIGTITLKEPKGRGKWWNIKWQKGERTEYEYGWNNAERRWARGQVPPGHVIKRAREQAPKAYFPGSEDWPPVEEGHGEGREPKKRFESEKYGWVSVTQRPGSEWIVIKVEDKGMEYVWGKDAKRWARRTLAPFDLVEEINNEGWNVG